MPLKQIISCFTVIALYFGFFSMSVPCVFGEETPATKATDIENERDFMDTSFQKTTSTKIENNKKAEDESDEGVVIYKSPSTNAPDAQVILPEKKDGVEDVPVMAPKKSLPDGTGLHTTKKTLTSKQSAKENPKTTDNNIKKSGEVKDDTNKSHKPTVQVIESKNKTSLAHVGYENAESALKEMTSDIFKGLNTRRMTPVYQQWKRYNASVRARSNSFNTGTELNNRCRLNWYQQLYQDPLASVEETEAYSRVIFGLYSGNMNMVLRAIRDTRVRMDLSSSNMPKTVPNVNSPEEAVQLLVQALEKAFECWQEAVKPLSETELRILNVELESVFGTQFIHGHTLSNVGRAKYLIDLMEKMDRSKIYDAVEVLLPVFDSSVLAQLAKISPDTYESYTYNGAVVQRIPTKAGDIIIGGRENNRWEPDNITNLACIIDLGGSDTYLDGVCNLSRPILLMIDLGEGNDTYRGTKTGIQGGSIAGVSILYNEQGKNTYNAKYVAQGSSLGGAGILFGGLGDDKYDCFLRGQGSALCGLGLLVDHGGNDDYHSAMLSQGLGNPGGAGILVDVSGEDHYYVGGYYPDSYEEHPGYDGWGQGIGAGIRQVACGGLGVILDGGGDDVYEFDYFAHGGGYWMGVGIARDFGGNDKRLGATLKAYNGGQRTEARWQRFSNGFGCHYAVGYLFDDSGNDFYDGTIMGLGMGWDLGAGFLIDFDGDDVYAAMGGLTQGVGAEGSIGVLLDYRGNDTYKGRNQGNASSRLTYHSPMDCGSNFSFVVDHGGNDIYGSRVQNNAMNQSGTAGGFIIDRPTSEELALAEAQKLEDEKEKSRLTRVSKENGENGEVVTSKIPTTMPNQNTIQQPASYNNNTNYPQQQPMNRGFGGGFFRRGGW